MRPRKLAGSGWPLVRLRLPVACHLRHALAAGALLFAAAAGAQPAAPTAAAPHMLTIATTSCVFSIHK
jgi:hypothetical protein